MDIVSFSFPSSQLKNETQDSLNNSIINLLEKFKSAYFLDFHYQYMLCGSSIEYDIFELNYDYIEILEVVFDSSNILYKSYY
ncbi:hypothetical protein ACMC56_08810 [Campylobacterota bacterium DY0563]